MKKLLVLIIAVVLTLSAATFSVCAAEPIVSVPVTDGNVYKNLYFVFGDNAVEDEAAVPAKYDKLAGAVDIRTTAYLTFAVYVPKDGNYSFKLSFTGSEYAAVKVGNTVTKAYPDTAFSLKLSRGINLITCFGATCEQPGAEITYSALFCENGLNPIEGDFYVGGDVNSDKSVDIRDLVRYKKFFAKTAEIKTAAADLNKDGSVYADDMTTLRQYLLGVENAQGAVSTDYELSYVMRDNDVSDSWDY